MKIEIRHFASPDINSITEIINFNILNSTAIYDYHPRTKEQQLQIFEKKIRNGFPILVATAGNCVVGFGYYSEFRFLEAYQFTVEHSVYISPNHQGKGIGKLIIKELIALATSQKLHSMIAVIDSENESSIDFHKKIGFKTVGTLPEVGFKFERWLNTVFMQLLLE